MTSVPEPEEILALDPAGADALLTDLEARVPKHPPLVRPSGVGLREALVFGDSHGDWRSVREVERRFSSGGVARLLVGLGDYVDRAPDDCGEGSVANALHLLALAASHPDRVFLLQGNHEAARRIPASPHHVPEEVAALWGDDRVRYDRLMALLERGPLAAVIPGGVFCAHAGFPMVGSQMEWARAFESLDEGREMQLLWAECDVSRNRRGAGTPWGGRDLERFFRATAFRVFLRGHDPDITGEPLFDGRCLTLQTTRLYQRFGGVIIARLPLGYPIESLRDVVIEHLPSEGQTYPPPR
jgi:Calcineurin-like phosphoesterase